MDTLVEPAAAAPEAPPPQDDPTRTAPFTLVCDYGALWTKATLVGDVGGAPRVIASVAVPTPHREAGEPDLPAATSHAGDRLRALTGIPEEGTLHEDAAYDLRAALVPVGSAAPPLDVVLVAPNAAAAGRAARTIGGGTYVGALRAGVVADLLAGASAASARPDAILVVDGPRGFGAKDVQGLAQLLARLGADTRLTRVLHCLPDGAQSAASPVLASLDTDVIPADLLGKSGHGATHVRRALNLLYAERSLARAGRTLDLPAGTDARFVSTLGSQAIAARYAGGEGGVLVLDPGASSSSACYARGEELRSGVVTGVGLGAGAAALYARAGEAALRRWLPFEPRPDELRTWALNRAVAPLAVPLSLREALVEQAFAREAVALAVRELGLSAAPERVIGCGTLARGMRPQVAAAVVVDALTQALPSWQQVEISVDSANVVGAMGALAAMDVELAARMWERDAPRTVATAIAARGAKRGAPALTAVLREGEEARETAVAGGQLARFTAPYESTLRLELLPARGVKLRGAAKGQRLLLELSPSPAYPLPQVLLDARAPQAPPVAEQPVLAAADLSGGGAYTARELEGVR